MIFQNSFLESGKCIKMLHFNLLAWLYHEHFPENLIRMVQQFHPGIIGLVYIRMIDMRKFPVSLLHHALVGIGKSEKLQRRFNFTFPEGIHHYAPHEFAEDIRLTEHDVCFIQIKVAHGIEGHAVPAQSDFSRVAGAVLGFPCILSAEGSSFSMIVRASPSPGD